MSTATEAPASITDGLLALAGIIAYNPDLPEPHVSLNVRTAEQFATVLAALDDASLDVLSTSRTSPYSMLAFDGHLQGLSVTVYAERRLIGVERTETREVTAWSPLPSVAPVLERLGVQL